MSSQSTQTPQLSSSSTFSATPALKDFTFIKVIGAGHSGVVYLARDAQTDTLVAVKVIPKSKGLDDFVLHEQDIQSSLDDRKKTFLLPLLSSFHDTRNFYLVTEYLGGNDMAIALGTVGKFSEERARFHAAELVVALEQLRGCSIIHRDIKPGNILFTRDGHIRLTDFGLAKKFYVTAPSSPVFDMVADSAADSGVFFFGDPVASSYVTSESVGTPLYMSREAHLGRPYSFETDLHGLGVLLYQVLTGRLPFGQNAKNREEIQHSVLYDTVVFVETDDISTEAQDLIKKLLVGDIGTIEDVKHHSFFRGISWEVVGQQTLIPPWKPFIPPVPEAHADCPVKAGEAFLSDPYPQFRYISNRLDCPKLDPTISTGFISRIGSIFSRRSNSASSILSNNKQPWRRAPSTPGTGDCDILSLSEIQKLLRPGPNVPRLVIEESQVPLIVVHDEAGDVEFVRPLSTEVYPSVEVRATPKTMDRAPLRNITNKAFLSPDSASLFPIRGPVVRLAAPPKSKKRRVGGKAVVSSPISLVLPSIEPSLYSPYPECPSSPIVPTFFVAIPPISEPLAPTTSTVPLTGDSRAKADAFHSSDNYPSAFPESSGGISAIPSSHHIPTTLTLHKVPEIFSPINHVIDFSNTTFGVYPRALERAQKLVNPWTPYSAQEIKPMDYPRPIIHEKKVIYRPLPPLRSSAPLLSASLSTPCLLSSAPPNFFFAFKHVCIRISRVFKNLLSRFFKL